MWCKALYFALLLTLAYGECPCRFSEDNIVVCERNAISVFPDDFLDKCPELASTDLQAFDLQGQRISYLGPDSFKDFPNLVSLLISFNKIQEVDKDAFRNLVYLDTLSLQYNSIEKLPTGLFDGLISLKSLDVRNNPTSDYVTE